MKKLIAALAMSALTVFANDVNIQVLTTQNVRVTLVTNGALDAPPQWMNVGTATLQVDLDGMGALLVTNGPGTNTVTITATSQGRPLVSHVTAVVVAPPATFIAVSTDLIPK